MTNPMRRMEADPLEVESRKEADFSRVELSLFEKLTKAGVSSISPTAAVKMPGAIVEGLLGFLGNKNPFARNAKASANSVWIFDSVAYKPSESSPWKAEMQAAFFQHGRGDFTKAVAALADTIGLDGQPGDQAHAQKLIASRLKPFIEAIAPARSLPVTISNSDASPTKLKLGPSDISGISTQICNVGAPTQKSGEVNSVATDQKIADLPEATAKTFLVGPEGFAIISDIDDTIKITQTPDPIGILKTTFAEPAQYTSHMPEFYKVLDEQLQRPAWFYLSASPYNLYKFLHKFIDQYFPKGAIFLRDGSWQTLGGILGSLTQGVKHYKSEQIDKIHGWFPKRKFICIGDSTQLDPETYAEAYKKYPGWIHAIYIRKVLDAPHMEKKNEPERFKKAFEGVPPEVYRVFVLPDELKDHVSHVAGQAHLSVLGALSGYFCGQERTHQQLEKDRVQMAEE